MTSSIGLKMNKKLDLIQDQNKQLINEVSNKQLSKILYFLPIISGFILVWRFLLLINRTDILQEIVFSTQGLIFIFLVFILFVLAIGSALFIPSFIFILFSWAFEMDENAIPVPKKQLIKRSLLGSLFFLFLIFSFSFYAFKIKFDFSFNLIFFLYFIFLFISFVKFKETIKLIDYQKVINKIQKSHKTKTYLSKDGRIFFFFLKRKLYFLIFIFILSFTSLSPVLLILSSIKGGNYFTSWFLIFCLCSCLIFVSYIPALIYYNINKSLKSSLALICIMFSFTIGVSFAFPSNLFIKGLEKALIINSNQYNAIINKNIYPKDIFSNNEWEPQKSSDDPNIYHLKGEKLFNISSNVLFCPPGTYQDLINSSIYDFDEPKHDVLINNLKVKGNSCVVLDAKTTQFKKLLAE